MPLLPFLCLVILSIGVWKHVKRSEQPPLYDAINYIQKAKAFWDMVASGQWKNPLNLDPVVRPPGTILMSYPFGFSDDYKGFLARSVILPVFLFITALYIAVFRRQMSRGEHLDLAAVALLLASLPCFYHFEAVAGVNSPTYWGLVDSFLAAVAALAFATGYRAVVSRSWPLLALASLLTGLCLMIKPSGVIVSAVIVTVLIIIKIFGGLSRPGGKLFSIELFSFIITVSAGTGLMLSAALKSAYLSSESFKYGNTAVAILRNDFASDISLVRLENALYPAFGLNTIVLGLATAIAVVWIFGKAIRRRDFLWTLANLLKPVLASAVLVAGAFFWLVYADLSQVRYFYPFAFVSLMLLAIFLLDAMRGRSARYTRLLIYGSGAILFGNLTAMLYLSKIDTSWQQKFGVNLSSSSSHQERHLADRFLRQAKTVNRDLNVYAMETSWDFGSIFSAGLITKILKPTESSFTVKFPVDWQRPSAVLLKDLIFSDYILYHPITDDPYRRSLLTVHDIGNFQTEVATISAWLTQANDESGLKEVEVTTGGSAVKQVISPLLVEESVEKWAATYNWPDAFKSQNSGFFKNAEWASVSGREGQSGGKGNAEIFENTIAIDNVEVETVSPLIFGVDWRALRGPVPDGLFFFVHVLDGSGKIISIGQFPLTSQSFPEKNPTASQHTDLKTSTEATDSTLRYGFGVYQGPHAERLLTPAPAGTDFGGNRVVREVKLK
jgi:hypothetical protein